MASTALGLVPIALLIVASNAFIDMGRTPAWFAGDNFWVLGSVVTGVAALVVQAYSSKALPIAHVCVFVYYAATTLAMADSGMRGNVWTWHLGMPVLATLLIGRVGGLVWTSISLATWWWFGWQQIGVDVGAIEGWAVAGQVRLVESTLLMAFLTVASQAFLSAQRAAQASLRVAVSELKEEVQVRRDAEARAHRAAEDAKSASEAKARFLATMSHEIRTPLNGVLGAAQLLRETDLTAPQTDLLDTVRASGEVLLSVINDVLDYSELESGQVAVEAVPVDVRSLLAQAMAPLRLKAMAKGIDLTVDVDSTLPKWIEGDPTRLRQVVLNLAGNAVKFTDRGSVVLRAAIARDRWRLDVKDTGVGIDQATIACLFSPFVQAEASIRRRFGGSGLGLAIVRRLVEAMGGNCGVESTVGKGSRFWFELPLRVAEAPAAVTPAPILRETACRRILLVDDNAVNRMVAARMLTQHGHIVVEAEDGHVALQRLQETGFDIVFMDVQMPVMDGYQATRAIRRMPSGPYTPVIALTAGAQPGDREKVLAAGMDDYLAKPVRSEDLRAAVERWTAGRTPRPTIEPQCPPAAS